MSVLLLHPTEHPGRPLRGHRGPAQALESPAAERIKRSKQTTKREPGWANKEWRKCETVDVSDTTGKTEVRDQAFGRGPDERKKKVGIGNKVQRVKNGGGGDSDRDSEMTNKMAVKNRKVPPAALRGSAGTGVRMPDGPRGCVNYVTHVAHIDEFVLFSPPHDGGIFYRGKRLASKGRSGELNRPIDTVLAAGGTTGRVESEGTQRTREVARLFSFRPLRTSDYELVGRSRARNERKRTNINHKTLGRVHEKTSVNQSESNTSSNMSNYDGNEGDKNNVDGMARAGVGNEMKGPVNLEEDVSSCDANNNDGRVSPEKEKNSGMDPLPYRPRPKLAEVGENGARDGQIESRGLDDPFGARGNEGIFVLDTTDGPSASSEDGETDDLDSSGLRHTDPGMTGITPLVTGWELQERRPPPHKRRIRRKGPTMSA